MKNIFWTYLLNNGRPELVKGRKQQVNGERAPKGRKELTNSSTRK